MEPLLLGSSGPLAFASRVVTRPKVTSRNIYLGVMCTVIIKTLGIKTASEEATAVVQV